METTANQKLRLKKPNGWFPAGEGFLEAITVLSDGAVKLFVFLCLNADRRTAMYSASTRELGRVVGKSHRWVQTYVTQLEVKGLCSSLPTRIPHLGTIFRICDQYWPYASNAADADTTSNEYVTAIRNTFLFLANSKFAVICVHASRTNCRNPSIFPIFKRGNQIETGLFKGERVSPTR